MRVPRIQRTLENMSNRGRRQNHSPAASRSPRLQKLLADAGIASRRAAEKLILEGRVELNGRVVKELGIVEVDVVRPGSDSDAGRRAILRKSQRGLVGRHGEAGRLDEEAMLTLRTTHAHARRRDLLLVDAKPGVALFAGDDHLETVGRANCPSARVGAVGARLEAAR